MLALHLVLFNLVFGGMQGIIVWLFAEYVPPKHLQWIDAALHKGGVLLYATFCSLAIIYTILLQHLLPWEWKAWLLVFCIVGYKAFLVRALLFDPALNIARAWYTHREKQLPMRWNPWAVGNSAHSDRFIVWLAEKLHNSPAQARFCTWLATLTAAIFFFSHQ